LILIKSNKLKAILQVNGDQEIFVFSLLAQRSIFRYIWLKNGTQNLVINLRTPTVQILIPRVLYLFFEPATNKSTTDDNGRLAVSSHNVWLHCRLLDSVGCIYRKERMISREELVPNPIMYKEKKVDSNILITYPIISIIFITGSI